MIPRRHDWYVLRAYWGSVAAVIVFFTVITITVDVAERMSRILKNSDSIREAGYDTVSIVAQFYGSYLPFILVRLVPFAAVLGAAIALSRLTRHHELSPLVTAGTSTQRITLPILVSGCLLAGLLLVMQEFVMPSLSRHYLMLDRLISKRRADRMVQVPHFQAPDGVRLSMAAFYPSARRLEGALLTVSDEEHGIREMRWYPILDWAPTPEGGGESSWIATEGGTMFPLADDPTGRSRRRIAPGTVAPLEADAKLLELSLTRARSLGLSAGETARLVRADPENPRLRSMYHSLFTRPLSTVVLLLLGLPFFLRLGQRSALPGIIAALACGVLYQASTFLVAGIAAGGDVNPAFLAWAPTALFGSLGAAGYLSMES